MMSNLFSAITASSSLYIKVVIPMHTPKKKISYRNFAKIPTHHHLHQPTRIQTSTILILYSCTQFIIVHSSISHLRSDLGDHPRVRLTRCVAGLQVITAEEIYLTSTSLTVDSDNTSPSGISSVSCTSSFHYRTSYYSLCSYKNLIDF